MKALTPQINPRGRVPAFSLVELLVVIAIIALLIGLIVPALASARGAARKAKCQSNMRQQMIAYTAYSGDFKDAIATFTWMPFVQYNPAFPIANNEIAAAAYQAADILNRLAHESFPPDNDWFPHPHYNHLIINDYLSSQLPELSNSCPEDRVLLQWQGMRDNFTFAFNGRLASENPADLKRLCYLSSYQLAPASYSADKMDATFRPTMQQGQYHDQFISGAGGSGNRKMADVSYPAQKVAIFDRLQRHDGYRFYAYPNAKQPLAFFDGSISERKTGDANQGFQPNYPTSGVPTRFYYQPDTSYEPPTASGAPKDIVYGYYQWTKNGLRGFDFGKGQ